MQYIRVTKGVRDFGQLIKPEEIQSVIKDNSDYYSSTYYYNEDHLKQFQQKGSIAGIKDVKSNKIWFDFDTKDGTVEDARKNVLELLNRLKAQQIDPNHTEIYFSGQKGFTVVLNVNKDLSPDQVKTAANIFAKDLETFDTSLYDAPQLLRIPKTKHQESGLYKIPLTINQLENYTIEQIRNAAKTKLIIGKFDYKPVELPETFFQIPEKTIETKPIEKTDSFNLRSRPKGWKISKWALVQGEMKRGERDTGCLIILATCRSLGYDISTAYYIAKGALKRAHEKYGEGSFTKKDLWCKTERVYSAEWQGGSFTSENEPLLQKVCERLNIKDENPKALTMGVDELINQSVDFAENIDSLTMKTGIEPLDDRLIMTVGMSVGLIAPPGAGKTSIGLQVLNNLSKKNIQCVFFSYDMYASLVGVKMIQKHHNKPFDEVMKLLKSNNAEFKKQVKELMQTEYANVEFCFQNGQHFEDIEETIKYVKDKKGKPVRFALFDYNELIATEYSDPTHSSLYTAQKIRQLANEQHLLAFSLFQPSKMSGDPSQEITSYRAAKGSSAIEQSLTIILGMSRPGCTPELADNGWDEFAIINCLKNRFGGLFRLQLTWNPIQGIVRKLNPEESCKFNELKEMLTNKKNDDSWRD